MRIYWEIFGKTVIPIVTPVNEEKFLISSSKSQEYLNKGNNSYLR